MKNGEDAHPYKRDLKKPAVSVRQAEIATMVATGRTNLEIAAALYLSQRTVESHVAALFQKLGVRSRTELAAAVLRGDAELAAPNPKTNLPPQFKRLVGRDGEIRAIVEALGTRRFVTLTGTGGIGKTQAALQVGNELLAGFADGVWLVELAVAGDTASPLASVAGTLGVRESPDRPLMEVLVAHLQRKASLLVLDNCEHVIVEAATIANAVLRECPRVRILATSREPLNVAAERTFRIPSLRVPMPATASVLRAADAAEYAAIELFAERARGIDHRFALTDENAPIVAAICRRLDGIPLAIELAAARLKVLSCKALLERLDRCLELLAGGERTAPSRHQTMAALIDWSYDLLSLSEQRLFEYLSVFVGGSTLWALTEVHAGDCPGEAGTLDLLSSLVDKSLVIADLDGDQPRYRLLEPLREYARAKLVARGDLAVALDRHGLAYLALGERLESTRDTARQPDWLAQTQPELENWRAALRWALHDGGDTAIGLRLAGVTLAVFATFAMPEGRRWIRRALELSNDATAEPVKAKLEFAEASLAESMGEHATALAMAHQALSRFRKLGDAFGAARAQCVAGRALVGLGRVGEGEDVLEDALAATRALGGRRLLGLIFSALALSRMTDGDIAGARRFYAEELRVWNATGAEADAGLTASNLAEIEFQCGDVQSALQRAREALAVSRTLNEPHILSVVALTNMAAYLVAVDRFEEARLHAREVLDLTNEVRFDVYAALAIQHLAAIAALRTAHDPVHGLADRLRAARMMGFVDARLGALKAPRGYTEQLESDRILRALRAEVDPGELDGQMLTGAAMAEDEAIADAWAV